MERRGRLERREVRRANTIMGKPLGATIVVSCRSVIDRDDRTATPPVVRLRRGLLLSSRVQEFGMINKQKQRHLRAIANAVLSLGSPSKAYNELNQRQR